MVNGILLRNLPSSVNENISNHGTEEAGGTWSESKSESESESESLKKSEIWSLVWGWNLS